MNALASWGGACGNAVITYQLREWWRQRRTGTRPPLGSVGMDYWMTRKRLPTPGSPGAREIAKLREILSLIPDW